MNMGAERAASAPATEEAAVIESNADWLGTAEVQLPESFESAAPPPSPAARALAAALALLAIGWTAAFALSIWQTRPAFTLPALVGWIATWSAPLVLLALVWLWLGRTPRREAERFTRAVERMRQESAALERVLETVSGKIETNHARLRGETEKLMSLGDEASDRLGRVTYYLSKESNTLDRRSAALESAAAAARVDLGVLLHDLPKAEEQARAIAEAMKDAGLAAHGQAGALEAQLAALSARGREADEVVGSAAQRMAAHVARIDSNAASAAATMNEASASMTAAVDSVMARAAEAIDAARSSLEAQAAAMLATIDQSRASLDRAGEDAARSLAHRVEEIGGKIQKLADHLAAQDAASQALLTGLSREIGELDGRIASMGESGGVEMDRLTNAVDALRAAAAALIQELGAGQDRAGALIDRTHALAEALEGLGAPLDEKVPQSLAAVEAQAGRTREALAPLAPMADRVRASAEAAAAEVGQAEGAIARGRDALEALLARLGEGAAESEARLGGLRAIAGEALTSVEQVSAGTGPELIDRANRVAETLAAIAARLGDELPASLAALEGQAERAREAFSPLGPVAERLEASADAAAARAAEAEAIIGRIGAEAADGAARIETLRAAAGEAEEKVARIVSETGPELAQRAGAIADMLSAIATRLHDELPAGLNGIEVQAERMRDLLSPLAPLAAGVQASADAAAARFDATGTAIARQREALDALLVRIEEGSTAGGSQLEALAAAAETARDQAARIAAETGPELVEALLRVRETANQAAERAREAIAAVIPQSAAALGEASREALSQAIGETVEAQMAELSAASQKALATAREASERLTRQMVSIGETTAAIEARIEEERQVRETQDSENFSRRVALLIESLNSTSIDVTKILSNDVTDTAWAAYLKGDRGVFTRRAVRLLDSTEAREIVRHYEDEPEFREQVNRYIHDFEAMLRRILADRDGSPLGVTLLSSDMGKLYVALAQAIERLR